MANARTGRVATKVIRALVSRIYMEKYLNN